LLIIGVNAASSLAFVSIIGSVIVAVAMTDTA